ncbi:lipopolysaccharide biosynthesis protein [Aliikangiella sp. IMCC44653]
MTHVNKSTNATNGVSSNLDPAKCNLDSQDENTDCESVAATKVIQAEINLINKQRKNRLKEHSDSPKNDQQVPLDPQRFYDSAPVDLIGLGISGGGIRSAAFSVGVIQALDSSRSKNENENTLYARVDYLSTVSGGGYTGSAVSWFNYTNYTQGGEKDYICPFGIAKEGVRTQAVKKGATASKDKINPNQFLSYLRQHGKYLTPGNGFNIVAFIATIFKAMTTSLLFYFSVAFLAFSFSPLLTIYLGKPIIHAKQFGIYAIYLVCGLFGVYLLSGFVMGIHAWAKKRRQNHTLSIFLNFVSIFAMLTLVVGAYFFVFISQAGDSFVEEVIVAFYALAFLYLIAPGSTFYFNSNNSHDYNRRSIVYWRLGLITTLALVLILVLFIPWLSHVLFVDMPQAMSYTGSVSFFSLIATLFTLQEKLKKKTKGIPINYILYPLAAILILSLLALAYSLNAHLLGDQFKSTVEVAWHKNLVLLPYGVAALIVIAGTMINLNYLSIGKVYRDRLMETFMPSVASVQNNQWGLSFDADNKVLTDFVDNQVKTTGPYHLINTNLVLIDDKEIRFKGRGGDNFILSPLYCGSDATQWLSSDKFEDGKMTLATAMATSGAAVNPNAGVAGQGVTTNRIVSILMTLLNVRLGHWVNNLTAKPKQPTFWRPGLKQGLLGIGFNSEAEFLELSDGGHFENLAVYELIRRRVKTIIVSDAGADPGFNFADLGNLVEKVRADFGVSIRFDCVFDKDGKELAKDALDNLESCINYDLSYLIPGTRGNTPFEKKFELAERGFAIARIYYPEKQGKSEPAYLIYLKSTMITGLPADIYAYKAANRSFPDQPTSDQFFDENQFESYRELGYQITREMLQDKACRKILAIDK